MNQHVDRILACVRALEVLVRASREVERLMVEQRTNWSMERALRILAENPARSVADAEWRAAR